MKIWRSFPKLYWLILCTHTGLHAFSSYYDHEHEHIHCFVISFLMGLYEGTHYCICLAAQSAQIGITRNYCIKSFQNYLLMTYKTQLLILRALLWSSACSASSACSKATQHGPATHVLQSAPLTGPAAWAERWAWGLSLRIAMCDCYPSPDRNETVHVSCASKSCWNVALLEWHVYWKGMVTVCEITKSLHLIVYEITKQ